MLNARIYALSCSIAVLSLMPATARGDGNPFATRGSWVLGGKVELESESTKDDDGKGSSLSVGLSPEVAYFVAPGLALALGPVFITATGEGRANNGGKAEFTQTAYGVALGPTYYIQIAPAAYLSLGIQGGLLSTSVEWQANGTTTTDRSSSLLGGGIGLAVPIGTAALVEVLGQVTRISSESETETKTTDSTSTALGLATRLALVF